MKVKKIGYLNDNGQIVCCRSVEMVAILTQYPDTGDYTELSLRLRIGQGAAARDITYEIPMPNSILRDQLKVPTSLSLNEPFLEDRTVRDCGGYLFRNEFFLVELDYVDSKSEELAILLVKKQAYASDNRIKRLAQEVEAMERVVNQKDYARVRIPESVQVFVYARDEGKCVRCDSSQNLHFDHIIPVSKGGGNSESNIQLLCDYCNLQKSDNIGF